MSAQASVVAEAPSAPAGGQDVPGESDGLPVGADGANGHDGPPQMRAPPGKNGSKRDAGGKFQKNGADEPASEDGEQKEAPPPPQKFKRRLKIHGKEQDVEASEDDLWASYREGAAAKQKFEEAATLRKEAEAKEKKIAELEERLAKAPMQMLIDKGMRPEQVLDILENEFNQLLAKERMTPEQRELDQYRAKDAERAKTDAQRQTEAAAAKEEAELVKEIDEDSSVIGEALKLSKLPKDDRTFEMMAKALYANKRNGIGLTSQELASAAFHQETVHIDSVVSAMDNDDAVLDSFPKLSKRIAVALKNRYQKQRDGGGVVRPVAQPSKPERNGPLIMTDAEMDMAYGLRPKR